MKNDFKNIIKLLNEKKCNFLENVSMKKHTTFGIGGKVKLFILPKSLEELQFIIELLNENNIDTYFIGSGSNLLVSDNDLKCAIISLKKTFKKIEFKDQYVIVESGVMLSTLVRNVNKRNIKGFESLLGVPGTVGGALIMNAGAFGSEISNMFISARTINSKGTIKKYSNNNVSFSYRNSTFPKNEILIDSIFKCEVGEKEKIKLIKTSSSNERKNKQPLNYRSAGSIFKNHEKFAAGYLIDKAKLKGMQIGDAQISEKHANFIVNKGNAKAKDVISLINIIKEKVYNKFKINIELEIKLIGIK